MKHVTLVILLICFSLLSLDTKAKIPGIAQASDSISISLSPEYFKPNQNVWVKIEVTYQTPKDSGKRQFIQPLTSNLKTLNTVFVVPEKAAMATFLYVTNDTLLFEPQTLRIVDSAKQYVRSARLLGHVITGKSYALLKQELSDYPDNLEAQQQIWYIRNRRHSSTSMAYQLNEDLPKLLKQERLPSFYYAAIWAYVTLENFKEAYALFDEFTEQHPDSRLILSAYDFLEQSTPEAYSPKLTKADTIVAEFLISHPMLEGAYNYAQLLTKADTTNEAIHDFFQKQIYLSGDVPLIYFHAAQIFQHRLFSPLAISYGIKARELLSSSQRNGAYYADRFHGRNYAKLWPYLTNTVVVSFMAQERYQDALNILKDGYSKSGNQDIDAELWTLQARCLEMVKDYSSSENYYAKAYKHGLKWTKESLRDLYLKQNKNATDSQFEAHFKQLVSTH